MDGNEIKRLRVVATMSQAELADLLGVTQGRISPWEHGRGAPSKRHISELRRALTGASLGHAGVSPSPGEDYGQWLRNTRDQLGLNRKELAAKSGVSQVQIYKIETSRTADSRDTTRGAT